MMDTEHAAAGSSQAIPSMSSARPAMEPRATVVLIGFRGVRHFHRHIEHL